MKKGIFQFYLAERLNLIKNKFIFVILFLPISFSIFSKNYSKDYSKGPLYGKNMYIPYLIFYNFNSNSARSAREWTFSYHISNYYINDCFILDPMVSNYNEILYTYGRDYESLVTEIGLSFFWTKTIETGFEIRFYAYYTGFLDIFIQGFHKAFGFPNGSREFLPDNQIFINIENKNGYSLKLNTPLFSFGDIDLWCKWTFFENKIISLAMIGSFKVPSGRSEFLSGSDFPDFGFSLLSDIRPFWLIAFYLQAGIVVPINSLTPIDGKYVKPMFNGIIGIEFSFTKYFSLLAQFNIKTSPMKGSFLLLNNLNIITEYLSSPQTNLLVGFIVKYKDFVWQFYFEEDTFTNAGVDISFNFMFKQSIRFKK